MRQKMAGLVLLAGVALTGLAPQAVVAEDGRGGGVCIYEHADYGGWEQCFGIGEAVTSLGQRNDRISSIRIRGRAAITLFQHDNFRGQSVQIAADVPNLGRWNDQASSLRVSAAGYRDRGDFRRSFGGRRSGEDRVCFYEHNNFQGRSECWDFGDDVADLRSSGWNDRISSIRTFGRVRLDVFEHINFGGQRLYVERDIADLGQVYEGRSSWNDRISSFRVSGGGRRD